jgi:hypothetical protein
MYLSIKAFICSKVQDSGIRFSTQNSAFKIVNISLSALSFLNSSIFSSIILSTLNLSPVFLSSTRGSEKFHKCQLASQVLGFIKIAASSKIISFLFCTNSFIQIFFIFSLNKLP